MRDFDKLVKEKAEFYKVGLLSETDPGMNPANGGGMGGDGGGGVDAAAPAPTPDMDAAPTPEQGAGQENPTWDRPYPELAELVYFALRTNFDEMDSVRRQRILALKADEIQTDPQAVKFLSEFESIMNEMKGVTPHDDVV